MVMFFVLLYADNSRQQAEFCFLATVTDLERFARSDKGVLCDVLAGRLQFHSR